MGWGLRIKKFVYLIFRVVSHKKTNKGGLGQFADLRGAWQNKRGRGVFFRGLIHKYMLREIKR